MKIYYAHHCWKYDTPIEAWELDLIRRRFPGCEIINPNGDINQALTERTIMNNCLQKVDECDALVFSSLSGVIGKGVFREVMHAEHRWMPVCYIHHGRVSGPDVTDKLYIEKIAKGNNRAYATVWLN